MSTRITMSLGVYEAAIMKSNANNSEGIFEKIADKYEDDLLESDTFPDGYFEFFLRLISEENFYSLPGVWNFLLVLGTEKEKLTSSHYEQISNTLIENYSKYNDEDLCLAVCDFVARNYSTVDARRIFDSLEKIELNKSQEHQGFVADGRRIMDAEEARRIAS